MDTQQQTHCLTETAWQVLDAAPIPALLLNTSGEIIGGNGAWQNHSQLCAGELSQADFSDYLEPAMLRSELEEWLKSTSASLTLNNGFVHCSKHNTLIRFEQIQAQRISPGPTDCEGLIVVFILAVESKSERRFYELFEECPIALWEEDFSEVKQLLDQLRLNGPELLSYLDAHPDLVMEYARKVRILAVNQAAIHLHEAREAGELSQHLDDVLSPDSLAALKQELLAINRGETQLECESTNLTLSGRSVPVIMKWLVLPGYETDYRRVIISLVDISERKQAEQERIRMVERLQEAQRYESLATMAGGVAHHFNNLLQVILGNAQLALCELPKGSETGQYLEMIDQTCQRAASVCRQMLACTGEGKIRPERINLSHLVEDMSQVLEAMVPAEIHIDFQLDDNLPALWGDRLQLGQVVLNIVSNAVEAITSPQGRILVKTYPIPGPSGSPTNPPDQEQSIPQVCLEVEDNGEGISKSDLDRVFDPFFSTKFTGRGLGMSAVKGIVRGHQGQVQITSKVGEGTSVKVVLPIGYSLA